VPHITAVGEVMVSLQAPAGFDLASTDTLDVRIAGAEANFAAAFIRAGGTAGLLSAVGDDLLGEQVLRRLVGLGIDVDAVHRDPSRPTGLMLNQRDANRRRVFYYRGGSAASALTVEQVLAGARGSVVISGVTFAVAADLRTRIEDLLEGLDERAVNIILDVNLRPTLGHVDGVVAALRLAAERAGTIFVGLDEAEPIFGLAEPSELARLIGARGADVVITDGAAGSWVHGQHIPAYPTSVVDPVGAGDAFAGTYTGLRSLGETPAVAAHVAARAAAQVVATAGDVDGLPAAGLIQEWTELLRADNSSGR
jgi:2-dehydro-3-deoxygluconokinase